MKTSILKLFGALLLFLSTITQTNAQDILGAWEGKLLVQGTEIPLLFNVTVEADEFSSTMDSPSQGATDIPMDITTFVDNTLTIKFNQADIKYIGTLSDNKLTGTFYQGGKEFPLTLIKTVKTLPGNTALPTSDEDLEKLANWNPTNYKYSVEDYFERPKARSFNLSPNGSYMAYREKDENTKNHVYVKNLETDEVKRVIEEKEELIRGFGWANDSRLVYIMDKGGNEDYHLFAVDIDGANQKELTPFDGVKVNILNGLKEDKNHMIISMNKNNPQIFEPFKINIETGDLKQLYKNEDATNPINGYEFDKDGNLRGFTKLRDGVYNDLYYTVDGENYEIIKKLSWKDNFNISAFNYATDYPHDAYVISNLDSDKTQIYLYDLKEDKII
jgi:Tol biopolymer transport system component